MLNAMDFSSAHEASCLWRMAHYEFGQKVQPHTPYWWNNRMRKHRDFVALQLNRRGAIIFRDQAGDHVVEAGTLLLFGYCEESSYGRPPDGSGGAVVAGPYECDHIGMIGAGMREHWGDLRRRFGSVITLAREPMIRAAMKRVCQRIADHAKDPLGSATILHAFVMELTAHLKAQDDRGRTPVERAVIAIARQPLLPFSIKIVAQQHGCSREHIERVFQHRFGIGPATYLRRAKLAHALQLLNETDLPLGTIALQIGVPSVATLNRWVREATGHPPTHVRALRASPVQGSVSGMER